MEIELLLPTGVGAPPTMQVELAGEITEADVGTLRSVPLPGRSPLQRITARHQALARYIAGGMETIEAAAMFNLHPATVKQLLLDPSFQALVQFHSRVDDDVHRSTQEKLSAITSDALDLLDEKINDPEERKKMSVGQVLEVITTGADRTGHGAQSSSLNVNVNVGVADRIKAAREAARRAQLPTESAA